MPADTVNIGGPTSQNTWAAIRSPLWKDTGYPNFTDDQYHPFPKNQNWSRHRIPFSSGYPEAIGNENPMQRAFPFQSQTNPYAYYSGSVSMCLGIYTERVLDEYDVPTSIYNYYLTIGTGDLYTGIQSNVWLYNRKQVTIGYPPKGPSPFAYFAHEMGFDYESVKYNFLGATVELEILDITTNTNIPYSIEIDFNMFPENQSLTPGVGTYIATLTQVGTTYPLADATPWRILSITMA
jgi:hypothetical protein